MVPASISACLRGHLRASARRHDRPVETGTNRNDRQNTASLAPGPTRRCRARSCIARNASPTSSRLGKDNCVIHKFEIGQIVDLVPMRLQAAAVGKYEIRQLMPASDIDSESPRYRVKSVAEKHERVVLESELSPTMGSVSV